MLRGPATINVFATDHAAAVAWYTQVLGVDPYYAVPGYSEFRFGDHQTEFGIIDAAWAPIAVTGPAGVIVNWAVDDLEGSLARLLELGATLIQPITERGPGFVTALVADPFGNVLGIMTNVHYLEMVGG